MPLTEEQEIGRAKNVVFNFLERRLAVPKIYIDAEWPGSPWPQIDVLAVDRDGIGDIHAVQMYRTDIAWKKLVLDMFTVPAHYLYIGVSVKLPTAARELHAQAVLEEAEYLFAKNGLGRIGVLNVDVEEGKATIRIRPERFRVPPPITAIADTFVSKHRPDFEMRP